MKFKASAIFIGVVITLAGCTSELGGGDPTKEMHPTAGAPSSSNTAASEFAIQTVKDRFEADCLAGLGTEINYRYQEAPSGIREGFVYASVGGNILQFAVGINQNTGAFLSFPNNEVTTELLTSVGC